VVIGDAGGAIPDGGSDAGEDGGVDGGSAGEDAGLDGGEDAGPDAGTTGDAGWQLRVLFIGNSFTYVNDLPSMLAAIAATCGVPPSISVDEVVQGAATLQTHWDNGIAQAWIADGGYTHVALQDQSLEPTFAGSEDLFFQYAQKFGDLIVAAGADPTWFVTWAYGAGDGIYPDPIDNPAEMQDELTTAYDSAARNFPTSVLACAGPAFQQAIAQHPEIALQQSDLHHPTVAGTYLAACTFYVALTGHPVPDTSSVPDGVSGDDAAILRAIAQIGGNCADVQLQGIARLVDRGGYGDFDPRSSGPFDYGTAGFSIPSTFYLTNLGGTAMGLSLQTVQSPFVWTSGAYPGGAGLAPGGISAGNYGYPIPPEVPYCGDTLAPYSSCAFSVSYDATSTSSGALEIAVSNAYTTSVARQLSGTATDRALLWVTDAPDFFCVDTETSLDCDAGESAPFTLFVLNRGGAATTTIQAAPLTPPFSWGGDAGSAFPGGVGVVSVDGGSFDYCTSQALQAGNFCLITGRFAPTDGGSFQETIELSYGDAQGPASNPATWNVIGATLFAASPVHRCPK
jgi:hypothetical protein